MKFVLVNGRTPHPHSFCALCCKPIGESYLRDLTTRLSYCDHECYVGHCELDVPARQKHARALASRGIDITPSVESSAPRQCWNREDAR